MSKITSPRDLLVEELKDLYSAESQLLKALPKMAESADGEPLKTAFLTHHRQTEIHAARLEKILQQLGESPRGNKCRAMKGLVEEGEEAMHEKGDPALLDLALIAAAQKVEHYEISGYSSARNLAERAGEKSIAAILQETLDEEGEADTLLAQIARDTTLVPAEVDDEI